MNIDDYESLMELGNKVRSGSALKAERDRFMFRMYELNQITEAQYREYNQGNSEVVEELVKLAVISGAILLLGFAISQLFSSK